MPRRSKPMKVIVGGMPRTGTVSITAALQELGFTPYDYTARLLKGELGWWTSMLKQKYEGNGTRLVLDQNRLDKLTGDYDAITDAPCFLLVEELANAYPDAKIILNERDITAWLSSIEKTLAPAYEEDQTWRARPLRWLDPTFARPIMLCDENQASVLCDRDYSDISKLKQRFVEHYDSIAQHVDKGRILKYRVQDGWKPLCDFLDVPCPPVEHPFPRANDSAELLDLGTGSYNRAIQNSIRNIGLVALVAIGLFSVFIW